MYWWVIVAITVLGGFAGWLFHFFQPPIHEAVAVLTVNMDFEDRQLTQFEEDYAFNAAGAIIGSIDVKDRVIEVAQASGIQLEPNYFTQHMFWEGKQSVWELRVRDLDPYVATELANIWAEAAIEALNTALSHALRADQLQRQAEVLEVCLSQTTPDPSPRPLPDVCRYYSLAEAHIALQSWANQLIHEKRLSMGILSIMKFSLTDFATVPEKPVLYNQGILVLAGAVIGFVISLWVVGSIRVRRSSD